MEPLVSVIIPTHNRVDLLPRSIRSVLTQSYTNLECIVVDDASTKDITSAIQQFSDDRLIYLRHKTNQGSSVARNTGIAHAKGEFIAFLDDDDEWLPLKLEEQVPHMLSFPETIGLTYCWMDYYDNEKLVSEHHPTYKGYVFPLVLDRQRIGGCPTLLVRRSVIEEIGGFDKSLSRSNDGDFIRRICLKYEVDFIPKVFVKVHVGHEHPRLTELNSQGIRTALKENQIKLVKFKEQLPKYPRQTASIYSIIADHYSQLGDWQNSLLYLGRACVTYPFNLSIYSTALRCFKNLVLTSR